MALAPMLLAVIVGGMVLAWAVAIAFLKGADLSAFDQPTGERFGVGRPASAELGEVLASLGRVDAMLRKVALRGRIAALRRIIDEMFAQRAFEAGFVAVDCDGVPGEWVTCPGADSGRRTLYIHGGGFVIGSPRSHRTLTSRFAQMTGGVVLAVDYRLMPEHRRMDGVEDCRTAYRWMIEHGPEGAHAAHVVFVAGESAGGNLTLSLIAWLRDQGLRMPDAAVVLSPSTDSSLASPSLRANRRSDAMLGPLGGRLTALPKWLLLWIAWAVNRVNPRSPVVSPVFGDLSGLPPVLVHACEAEMLLGDSLRYVNRARAAGSPVRLQTWAHAVHAWHIFNPELPEAREALGEIGKFLAEAAPQGSAAPRDFTAERA